MTDYVVFEKTLIDALLLPRRPVAVAFRETPPDGVTKHVGSQPSSCSFWRLAAQGRTFYTVPSDHYNCPVGAYTHNIPLPADREQELPQVLGLMSNIGYIRMDEVPGVPRLPRTPGVAIYSPLADTPVAPDVVILAGRPGGLMLLQEAGQRASKNVLPMLGRPTCMAIPAALTNNIASSLGCVGNRIYTGVSDDEFYTVIAGADLEDVMRQLPTTQSANATLTQYHQQRRAELSAG
jgi:uncharacterized protein (DUF169 family)